MQTKTKEDFYELLKQWKEAGVLPNGKIVSQRNTSEYVVSLNEFINYYGNPIRFTGVRQWFADFNRTGGEVEKLGQQHGQRVLVDKNYVDPSINILDEDFDFEEGDNEKVEPYVFPIAENLTGIFGDIHLNFHDLQAIKKCIKAFRERRVNTIIINGDFLDLYQISRFDNTPDRANLKTELELGKQFLSQLRQLFPSEKILYKQGNHCYRLEKYIIARAPQLFGIEAINLNELLGLKEFNITPIEQSQNIIFGDQLISHGHEWGIGGGINVARSMILKAWTNIIFNHFHISQSYSMRNGRGEIITANALGCMCNLFPRYRPNNNWSHGYGLVQMDGKGKCKVENVMI